MGEFSFSVLARSFGGREGGLKNFNCHVLFFYFSTRNSLATVVGRYILRLGSTS